MTATTIKSLKSFSHINPKLIRATIKSQVEAAKAELTGKTLKELYAWADAHGMNSKAGFPRFKAALKELGICDWAAAKAANESARAEKLTSQITHEVTLYSDAKAKHDRFAICDKGSKVLWYGRFFEDDRDGYNGEQSSGELSVALKAIWLALQVRIDSKLPAIRLNLIVDANWLCTLSGKAAVLSQSAREKNIELNVSWIQGTQNPADKWTTTSGYRKWNETPAASLAQIVGLAPSCLESSEEIQQETEKSTPRSGDRFDKNGCYMGNVDDGDYFNPQDPNCVL